MINEDESAAEVGLCCTHNAPVCCLLGFQFLEFGRCTHRTSKIGNIGACWNIGESARQVADVDVVKNSSVVTTTELSPPPRWLATIEPYSVVGGVSGCCFMKTAPHSFADLR